MTYHEEPIYRDGSIVGRTTSSGYGHTVGGNVAFGYIANAAGMTTDEWISSGRYEIEFAAARYGAEVSLRALHDPDGRKMRG